MHAATRRPRQRGRDLDVATVRRQDRFQFPQSFAVMNGKPELPADSVGSTGPVGFVSGDEGGVDIVIDVAITDPLWADSLADCRQLAQSAVLETLACRPGPAGQACEVSLVLSDDAAVRGLNRDYRGRDKPTNVLSFPAQAEPRAAGDGPWLLGDVVLARETLLREAADQDKPLRDHFAHLVVHGVLHLLGHDHINESEAETMERLEAEALGRLGIPNPYLVRPGSVAGEPRESDEPWARSPATAG